MTSSSSSRPKAAPAVRFRNEISAAVAEGASVEDMVLHLTLRDANLLARDPAIPIEDISYKGGTMRFLGVRVEQGGVPESSLLRQGS